jgi:hypothetical protein
MDLMELVMRGLMVRLSRWNVGCSLSACARHAGARETMLYMIDRQ